MASSSRISSLAISLVLLLWANVHVVNALNIVIPGGTGKIGQKVAATLGSQGHSVKILCRNAFLAAAPARVSSDFGWVGKAYLNANPRVSLRDWDGGDLLDIVGQDWLGWQEDALTDADAVINLVGGFTDQRVMACERIVRESLSVNPTALQITLSPIDDDLTMKLKKDRVALCEKMVKDNCMKSECLRVEVNDIDGACQKIMDVIDGL